MTSGPRLSAIVPATDEPPTLARCLDAIRSGARVPDEVIVVTEPRGSGPAAARNEGARRAGGELLVFVDADVVVHDDALARIEERFEADRGLTALFGSYDDAPEAPGAVSGFRNLLHHHVHSSAPGPAQTFWAGLGAVRREALLEAGGFDAERYPLPSVEDIELGARLIRSGARIELDPAVRGKHLKAWTLTGMVRTDFARRGVPWTRLLLDEGGPSAPSPGSATALNLGWRHRVSALASVAGAAAIVRRRPLGAAAALATLIAVNRELYALLLRRRGPVEAAAGVGLHAIHHLTGVAALVAGAAQKSHQRT